MWLWSLTTGIMFLLFTCMYILVWGILRRSSTCVPSAYEVVRDSQMFEKQWVGGTEKKQENLKSREPASGLGIDHRTSVQKTRGANHWAACTQVKKLVEIHAPSTMAIFLLCVHSVGSHLWPYKLFLSWVLTIQQCWILSHWQSWNICTAGYFKCATVLNMAFQYNKTILKFFCLYVAKVCFWLGLSLG
jgi:hypothetical protein